MIECAYIPLARGSRIPCTACAPVPATLEHRPAEEIIIDVRRAVAGMAATPGPAILLGECEPFSHPELVSIVTQSVAAGVRRLGLRSDASALTRGDNASGAISAGVRRLDVTLLGGDESAHDRLYGRPGSFAVALAGMQAFREVGERMAVPVVLTGSVPVCRHVVTGIPAIVERFARSGASSVELVFEDPSIADTGTVKTIIAACETGIVNGVWVSIRGLDPAALGRHVLHGQAPVTCREIAS